MLDKTIPYHDIIMKALINEACTHPPIELPEGYSYKMYEKGDDVAWANLELSVEEFASFDDAISYFNRVFRPYEDELKHRMCFIVDEKNTIVATSTAWFKDSLDKHYPLLHWVATSPNHQRKGLGKAIVIYALSKILDFDKKETYVYLHTQTWSYKAIVLYTNLGFKFSDTPLKGEMSDPLSLPILKELLTIDQYNRLMFQSDMDSKNRPIGIFDSGLGGISVLNECQKQMPYEHFIYYGDSKHAPYGFKSKEEITKHCIEICDFLIKRNVKAIIIACNTATSASADVLRERYDIPIIGMEPALKPATLHSNPQNIIVMATQLTLDEKKFNNLMNTYGKQHNIMKMPCPKFVEMVEADSPNKQEITNEQVGEFEAMFDFKQVDSIVLGCTHFIFIKDYIRNCFPKSVTFIDGNYGTAKQLYNILDYSGSLAENNTNCEIYNSSNHPHFIDISEKLNKIK